tara:strand:- start:110 stop:364 length:255 start_codon:yes stop_codon:yes gene_type:complete
MWFGEYNVRNQKHGLNVILLDHVSFGGSGGAVRQSINSCGQAKDYQYIVDFVRTLVNKKNGKLVLLGDSFFETFKANFEAREFR